jgi:Helix-turn-helix domain
VIRLQRVARGRVDARGGTTVAELKKGSRVTGTDRDDLTTTLRTKYDGGASIRELAAATGRSYGFIHRVLSESGAKLRGRGGATRSKRSP